MASPVSMPICLLKESFLTSSNVSVSCIVSSSFCINCSSGVFSSDTISISLPSLFTIGLVWVFWNLLNTSALAKFNIDLSPEFGSFFIKERNFDFIGKGEG